MNYQRFKDHVVFRVDPGEELVEQIQKLCTKLDITSGTITGIGATNDVTVGVYEVNAKKYHSKTFTGDHEITNISGNITRMNDETYIHLHITLGNMNNEVIGGHLNKARISATFEGVITPVKGTIHRRHDSEVGLNLLDI